MYRHFIILLVSINIAFNFIKGQQADDKPMSGSLMYLGDFAGCYHGGIQTGFAYMGLVDLSASLNTAGMNLWNGGTMLVNVQNTHHSSPDKQLAGDLQVFDNIDNGNQTYLYQLWYRQQLGRLWLLAGLHDLNSEFFSDDNLAEFVNSSFGIMPVASLNSPVSIFPNTTMGFLAGYQLGPAEIKAGIYEGDPGNPETDPYNLDLLPDFNNGMLGIIETGIRHGRHEERNGHVRAGLLVHTGSPAWLADSLMVCRGNYHVYAIINQRVFSNNYKLGARSLDVSAQSGIAPGNRNLNDFYFSLGLRYSGMFTGKGTEILGIALAHASISNHLVRQRRLAVKPNETVAELYYRTNLNRRIFLQPDLQYIINPGIDPEIKNAFIAILRIGINF